jgi:H+/Cl- antiporter ClcA
MPDRGPQQEPTTEQVDAVIRSRSFVVLMLLAAFVGVVVSFAAWLFLEATVQLQQYLWEDLPGDAGWDAGPPLWYLLVILGLAGLLAGLAIGRLPGHGGHVPAHGLAAGGDGPPVGRGLAGVLLASGASIGFGVVLGPEAPLIALGGGLAVMSIRRSRREVPDQTELVVAAAGSFAAIAFIFASPIIAAILLLEATGLGGARQRLVLIPGLMASAIGSLVSIGIGSVSGLSSADYALDPLQLPAFDRPTVTEFLWAVALPIAVTAVTLAILRLGRLTDRAVAPRPLVLTPLAGLLIALAAFLYGQTTDESPVAVLLSGEEQLPALIERADTLAASTIVLLLVFKGLAYGVSLGAFRGGPTFPAIFLGAATGVLVQDLPGLSTTPAVAICLAAATTAALRLPLSCVVLAILLTAEAGSGAAPLIIVAVVVAHMTTLVIENRRAMREPAIEHPVHAQPAA